MKKNDLVIISVIILILNVSEAIGQSRSSFELNFAPTVSYRNLNENMVSHSAAVRFDAGLLYQYSLKENIKIASGLNYSKKGYNGESTMTDDLNNVITNESKYFRNFIELPIYLKYLLQENSGNQFYVDAGIVNQLLIGELMEQTSFSDMTNNFSELREQKRNIYNVALLVGISFHKSLTERIYISVDPFLKYGLLSMDNIHDITIGLKLGIGIRK